jgi:hypothetical protein
MNHPTGGREVFAPPPADHEPAPAGTSTHARPVVEPLYPALPVIEVDRRRSPRRASTRPGPFGTLGPAPVPVPVRAQHTPRPHTLSEETIEESTGPSSTAPSRIASASIGSGTSAPASAPAEAAPAQRNTGRHKARAAVALATVADAGIEPAIAPSRQASMHGADPSRHDATDLIPLRARSGAEPVRRRLAWGWYVALAAAAAFFLATIALSAS